MEMMKVGMWIPFAVLALGLAQQPNRPPNPPQAQPDPMRQGGPGGLGMQNQQPDFSALKSYLNLTDAQIRQMQQAREKARKDADEKEKTVRPQIEEKQNALQDLLDKDTSDAAAVGKTMIEIHALRKQMRQAREAVRNSEINVMNAEQKTKFKAIQDAANLPAATREAARLGLVPGFGQGPDQRMGGPQPRVQGPMGLQGPMGPGQNMRGPGQGPNMQGPNMQGPGPGPNMQGPGPGGPGPAPRGRGPGQGPEGGQ
jgi:Spy/CpxP family protein refolding chaperone